MSLPSLPYFASFDEIEAMLNQGQIKSFFVRPEDQRSNDPNTRLAFLTQDDRLFLVSVQYDPETNQIFPPMPSIVMKGPVDSSLIKWDRVIEQVFTDRADYLPRIPHGYSDTEIIGQVQPTDLNPIFDELRPFIGDRYRYFFQIADTHNGDQPAMVREWSSQDGQTRLQYCLYDDGWAVVFGSPTTFLVVGNNGAHPFVVTPGWSFDNSDGSTDDDFDPSEMTLAQIKAKAIQKTREFVFEQQH